MKYHDQSLLEKTERDQGIFIGYSPLKFGERFWVSMPHGEFSYRYLHSNGRWHPTTSNMPGEDRPGKTYPGLYLFLTDIETALHKMRQLEQESIT